MDTPSDMLEYFDPTNPKRESPLIVPAISELNGKKIAFINNGWPCFTKMGIQIERELRGRYAIAAMLHHQVPPSSAPKPGLLAHIAADCDAAIVGLAN